MSRTIGLTFEEKKSKTFVCEICDTAFQTKKELTEHVKKEHPAK